MPTFIWGWLLIKSNEFESSDSADPTRSTHKDPAHVVCFTRTVKYAKPGHAWQMKETKLNLFIFTFTTPQS